LSVFGTIGCSLGSHQWSDWAHEAPDPYSDLPPECRQIRSCTRCGHGESRFDGPHSWGEWAYEEPHCWQERFCERCDARKVRLLHDWAEWRQEDACGQERTCRRCGETEQQADHDWGEWVPSDDPKGQKRVCTRCGATDRTIDREAVCAELEYLLSGLAPNPRDRIRSIGQQLDDAGGMTLMLEVGHRIQRKDEMAASRLDGSWSGIGDWL
jgi:hypothetical protein